MASLYETAASNVAAKNTVDPLTQDFDESKGVAGRVADITSSGSPLMQLAATRGKQLAADRGLLSSSLAGEAEGNAVLSAATPIATADAQLSAQQRLANQSATNNARTTNATLGTQAGLQGISLDAQSDTAKAQRDMQESQFGRTLDFQGKQLAQDQSQFDANLGLQNKQLDVQQQQFASSQAQTKAMQDQQLAQQQAQFDANKQQQITLANMDAASRERLAQIQAGSQQDIQNSQNIAGAWGTMMQNIQAAQNNANLEPAAKQTMIQNAMDTFASFAAFWKKSTNNPSIDVSDLLNFGGAAAASGAAPAPAPAPATNVPPPYYWQPPESHVGAGI